MQTVGSVRQIARYPVKSMKGEPLDSAPLTLQGMQEDRRYAFVQTASRSAFPWFTAREMAELLLYATSVEKSGTLEVSVRVTPPSGQTWRVDSEDLRQLLEQRSGRKLFLLRDDRGSFDAGAISVISRQTVARIAEESGTPEEARRFRPNLLIHLDSGEAYGEQRWVGRILRIGATARIAITEVDYRCTMITLDPDTGEPSPAVLKCVAQQHGGTAGVYATVLSAGEIRNGDPISLE